MAFDFNSTKLNFQRLLRYDWQQSQSRGWTRVSQRDVKPDDVTLMGQANKHFGYKFIQGTSPVLGKTFIVDPEEGPGFGQYRSPVNAAFISAHGQVQAKHHSLENAGSALALHAYLQNIYVRAGAHDAFGDWSLGYNQQGFNAYKIPKDARESALLKHIHSLIDTEVAKTGEPSGLDMNYKTANGQVNRLKISDRPVVQKALVALESEILHAVTQAVKTAPQNANGLDSTLQTRRVQRSQPKA